MTLDEVRTFVIGIDPKAGHYHSADEGKNAYTRWQEGALLPYMGDGKHLGALRFQIDRFTKAENDTIADAFEAALEAADDIAFDHLTDYERDSGYIHHIFDCEAM